MNVLVGRAKKAVFLVLVINWTFLILGTLCSSVNSNKDKNGQVISAVGIRRGVRGRIKGVRQILYDNYGRRLRITPKECQSTSPRYSNLTGICVFNLECTEESGSVIGACVDRFLFGACCHIPSEERRKALLSQGLNSSTEITAVDLLLEKNATKPQTFVTPSSIPYSTRFPSRQQSPMRRVPSDATKSSISTGKYPNLPPSINTPTLLPLTLETFSSVSDPFTHSFNGNYDPKYSKINRYNESVERETLGLGFIVKRNRPSSQSKVKVKDEGEGEVETPTTVQPTKISTFMYVDGQDDKITTESTKTQELSNTENIWSVMMQLGSQDKLLGLGKEPVVHKRPNKPIESVTSMMAELIGSGDLTTESENEEEVTSIKYPIKFFGDLPNEDDDPATTEIKENEATTVRPWASSTYYVHTFKYPSSSGGDVQTPSTTTPKVKVKTTTQQPSVMSTSPSFGKITTWSGIGTVVDKEQLVHKHGIPDGNRKSEDVKKTTPMTTTTRPLRTAPTPSTTRRYTTKATTTTETPIPKKQITTEQWKKPQPYTLPPHKRRTTTESNVTLEDDEDQEEENKGDDNDTPLKEEGEEEGEEEPELKVDETHKKKQTKVKMPIKNTQEDDKRPLPNSIILDEDMDTNLDDFVEQVVQGLAGSLDNLNFDNVILNVNKDETNPEPTVDPLQLIADPSFPPYPIVSETPLTKPNVKVDKQKLDDPTTTTTPIPTSSTTTTPTTTQRPLDWKKDCGVRTLTKSGRIVGGSASKFGRWPWQALVKEATWLGLFSKNKCGGVLIAPKYVLTAAHCQPGFLATLTVVLGEFDISSGAESHNAVTKNVRRVIVHRDYNAQTFENDIALLELDSPVDYKSHIVPICLPEDEEEFLGKKAFVTGWGRLKYGGGVPQILHEVDVPILKNDECQDMFHKSNHLKAIRDSFICAGYAEGFKDSCEGDSGGPLSIQRTTGQWVLAGTVSHGIKCAYPNLPGVYMRMTFYKPWIKRVTGIK